MCSSGSNAKTNTGTQEQTSTTSPTAQAFAAYQGLLDRAETAAGTVWDPATQQQIAGFTPDQLAAFSNIRGGIAQPYIDSAAGLINAGSGSVAGNMAQYQNPYLDQVINATQADFDRSNAKQLSDVTGNARLAGSLGGDREAVAKALTAAEQARVQNPVIANLRSQGYNTALSAAQSDAARSLTGGNAMASLGPLAYTDANALLGIGGQQQQLDQAQLDANSANASAQAAYPFQTTQWLAGILGAATPNMGSTTTSSGTSTGTTTGPTPNTWSQAIGGGLALASLLASGGRIERAPGGAISYVPDIGSMPKGGGIQAAPMMQFGSMGGGGGDVQPKSFADHWKDVQSTANATKGAVNGINTGANNLGKWMNSSTTPGGWNTTTDYGNTMSNLSAGIQNVFGWATGGAVTRATGGGVDDNDPAGSYDAVPDGIAPRLTVPLMEIARARAAGPEIDRMQMPSGGNGLAPMTDVPIRDQTAGMPAGAKPDSNDPGGIYDAAPAPILGQGALNPTGAVASASTVQPMQTRTEEQPSGIMGRLSEIPDRLGKWIGTDDYRNTLLPMGLAMMAASREGGKGTTGVHVGIGGLEGLKSQAAYRESERKQAIEKQKMALAERAQQIREADEGRAAAMHPYDIEAKKQAIATAKAASEAGKFIQVDPSKSLFDAKTGRWVTSPDGGDGLNDPLARAAALKYAESTPKLIAESRTAADDARNMVRTVDEMKALSQNMYTGALADQKLAAAKIGRALGLDFDATKIANSEQFQAKMQDFVLTAAQKLKPLSNSDVAFVEKGMPVLARDPAAIGPMLDGMRRIAERNELIERERQKAYARGRAPNDAAIEEMVNKVLPPPGGVNRPNETSQQSPQSSQAPQPSAAEPRPAQPSVVEGDRQKLLAVPDGLVQFKGKVYVKNGTTMTPAPEGSYRRGFFGSLGAMDGSAIPSIP